MNNAVGRTTIDERALERIIRHAVDFVPGTTHVGMSLENPGGRSLPRYDILVNDVQRQVSVEAFICATWPAPTVNIAEQVRKTIIEWVEAYTGYATTHVNVYVGAVIPSQTRTTAAQIAQAPGPDAQTPSVRRRLPGGVSQPRIVAQSAHTDTNAALRDISVNSLGAFRDVEVLSHDREVPVTAPSELHVERPRAPQESRIVPQFSPERPEDLEAPQPEAPAETPLRKISVHHQAPKVKVKVPRPAQLKRVRTVRREAPAKPRVPREQPLKPFAVIDMTPQVPITIRPSGRYTEGRQQR